jgi:hypothetical protein
MSMSIGGEQLEGGRGAQGEEMGNSGKHTRLGLVALCAALELTAWESA